MISHKTLLNCVRAIYMSPCLVLFAGVIFALLKLPAYYLDALAQRPDASAEDCNISKQSRTSAFTSVLCEKGFSLMSTGELFVFSIAKMFVLRGRGRGPGQVNERVCSTLQTHKAESVTTSHW